MDCPHCHQPLSAIEIETSDGHQHSVEECLNCGGHFLEPYLANFLTTETARNVDSILPKSNTVPATNPTCSKCGQAMPSIKDDAVPQTVTVFTCPNGHGDFFPKNQLLLFKQAQQSKIYYHKIWGIPLKSAFAVLIPVLVIFSFATILPSIIEQTTNQETRIKASDLLTPPLVTPISQTQVLISFSTHKPSKTYIKFITGTTGTYTISETPQTNHLINIPDLKPNTAYKYILILEAYNKKTTSQEYTFSTP